MTTVGSSADHKAVLENPDSISKTVLEKGLDAGTAFEILSIDIADVDVGRNIGAQLQIDQAEADKNIACQGCRAQICGSGFGTGNVGPGSGNEGG